MRVMSFYRPIIFFGRKLHYIFLILLGLPGVQTWHVNGTSVDEILIPPKISGGPSAEVSYIFFLYLNTMGKSAILCI